MTGERSSVAEVWADIYAAGASLSRLDPVQESLAWLERDAGGPLAVAAINALTLHYIRFVGKVMRHYRFPVSLDLYQEGVLGLRGMVIRYDRRGGLQFSTVAYAGIRGAMRNYRRKARRWAASPLVAITESLTPGGRDDAPGAALMDAERLERVRWFLGRLPARERLYLELHFGLDGAGARTFAAVARMLDPPVSPQWVRQVVMRGLVRLKADMGRHDLTFEGAA